MSDEGHPLEGNYYGGMFDGRKAKRERKQKPSKFVPEPEPPKQAQKPFVPMSLPLIPEVPKPDEEDLKGLAPFQRDRMLDLLKEAQRRQMEALRLWEPLPTQLAFHTSMSRQRIARGSNRSGKTTVGLVELALAVTGQHYQPGKYPTENGRAIVVAKDEGKIGEVIWRKLGRAGSFKMVKDPESGQWRAHRPATDPPDLKTKPSMPLLPPRFIKDISWFEKKSGVPRKVILKNGWEITFYSSKSDPFSIQGTDIDIVVFDEEIVHADWYPEAITRLVDRVGYFWWMATPQTGTQNLYDLHLRAESWAEEVEAEPAKALETPPVKECFMSVYDNPHLPAKAMQDWIDSLDDDQKAVRVEGEFAISGLKIYESHFFPRGLHGAPAFPIPEDWTRYVTIDPGSQVAAVLFAAVPPSKAPLDPKVDASLFGDYVYLYDELYIRGCDAAKLAVRMSQKIGGQEIYEFIIDHHGGRMTEIASGRTPEQQYREAFKREGVKSTKTGHSFTYGSDDLDGGILRVKEFLRLREDGTSRIRVVKGSCPNLVNEMLRYQWKVTDGVITDKPRKRNDHLCDCIRYLCMLPNLRHRKPKPGDPRTTTGFDAFKAFKEREKKRRIAKNGVGVTLG